MPRHRNARLTNTRSSSRSRRRRGRRGSTRYICCRLGGFISSVLDVLRNWPRCSSTRISHRCTRFMIARQLREREPRLRKLLAIALHTHQDRTTSSSRRSLRTCSQRRSMLLTGLKKEKNICKLHYSHIKIRKTPNSPNAPPIHQAKMPRHQGK